MIGDGDLEVELNDPARRFSVGLHGSITITHSADIQLSDDEQVTFKAEGDSEYDFVRKSWGYYASPSINGRLKGFGFRSFLVTNQAGYVYFMVVDRERYHDFLAYCSLEEQEILLELTNGLPNSSRLEE